MKNFLESLLASLNQIEVKGRNNMDYLLGAILAVERAIAQLETEGGDENGGD